MKIFILITSDNVVGGVYSNKDKLISDFSTIYTDTDVDRVEIWDINDGFIKNMKLSKKTTITIED